MTTPRGPEAEWERRRRLASVFGDVLPESTSDDRDDGRDTSSASRERSGMTDTDEWLRAQVPPHHGGE